MGRFVPSNQLLLRRGPYSRRCEDGRISGAVKMAGVWLIPKDADKPADRRYKQSKEIDKK